MKGFRGSIETVKNKAKQKNEQDEPFEVTVQHGHNTAIVKVYPHRRTIDGERVIDCWQVKDKTRGPGKHRWRQFADREKAANEASRIAKQIANGHAEAAKMTPEEKAPVQAAAK